MPEAEDSIYIVTIRRQSRSRASNVQRFMACSNL